MNRTRPNRLLLVLSCALLASAPFCISNAAAGEAAASGGVMVKDLGTLYPIRSERGEVFLIGPVSAEKVANIDLATCEAKLCGEVRSGGEIASASITGLEMRAYSNTGLLFLRMAKSNQVRPMRLDLVEEPQLAWDVAFVVDSNVVTKPNPAGNGWMVEQMPWLFTTSVTDAGRSVAADGSAIRLHLATALADGVLLSKEGRCLGLVSERLRSGHVTFALPARQIARLLAGVIDMANIQGCATPTGGALQAQMSLCDPEGRITAIQLQVLDAASQKVLTETKAVVTGRATSPLRVDAEWPGFSRRVMRLVTIYKDGRSDSSPAIPVPAGTFALRIAGASDGKPEALDPLLPVQWEEIGLRKVMHVHGGRMLLQTNSQGNPTHRLEILDVKTWLTLSSTEIRHFEFAAGPNVVCSDIEGKRVVLGPDLRKVREMTGGMLQQPLDDAGLIVEPRLNPKTRTPGLVARDLATGKIIAESPLRDDLEIVGRFAGSARVLLRTRLGHQRQLQYAELNRERTGWDMTVLKDLQGDNWKPLVGITLLGMYRQSGQRLYVMGAMNATPFYGLELFPQPDGRLAALDASGYLWDIDPRDGTPLAPPLAWLPAGEGVNERTVYFVDLRTGLAATKSERFHTLHRLPLVAAYGKAAAGAVRAPDSPANAPPKPK